MIMLNPFSIGWIQFIVKYGRWRWKQTINDTKELMTFEEGLDQSTPKKIVVNNKLNRDKVRSGLKERGRRKSVGGSHGMQQEKKE